MPLPSYVRLSVRGGGLSTSRKLCFWRPLRSTLPAVNRPATTWTTTCTSPPPAGDETWMMSCARCSMKVLSVPLFCPRSVLGMPQLYPFSLLTGCFAAWVMVSHNNT